jgi:UDP-glucose 4-epimerase
MKKTILIIWGLSDNNYFKVIELINKGLEVIIIDNLQSWCLKNLRLIMNEVWFPPRFYEVDYYNKSEMKQIYKKYKIDNILNLIKKDS